MPQLEYPDCFESPSMLVVYYIGMDWGVLLKVNSYGEWLLALTYAFLSENMVRTITGFHSGRICMSILIHADST